MTCHLDSLGSADCHLSLTLQQASCLISHCLTILLLTSITHSPYLPSPVGEPHIRLSLIMDSNHALLVLSILCGGMFRLLFVQCWQFFCCTDLIEVTVLVIISDAIYHTYNGCTGRISSPNFPLPSDGEARAQYLIEVPFHHVSSELA